MIFIPKHITDLSPYKPGKSSDPADFARYKAILSSNENNYGPSPKAMKAIVDQVHTVNLYPDPQGANLIQKLAQKHDRRQDEFILSNGLDGLLYSMFKAFTVHGDHVITNDNSFVAFNKFAKMNNVNLGIVPNKDYQFNLKELVKYIQPDTRIIYLCNPNNPTGARISTRDLKSVLENISEDILVVVDEAYFDYAQAIDPDFPDSSKLDFPNILTLRTFSKLYGLAGLRIGYGIGQKSIVDALKKVKLVFNPNTLAQIAALHGLEDHEHVAQTVKNNNKWIEILERQLSEKNIRFIKSAANFVCAIFEDSDNASSFFKYMDDNHILLRQLDAFGMPEGIRISIGTEEEMQYFSQVLDRY